MVDIFFILAELAVNLYLLVSAFYFTPTANAYERTVLMLLAVMLVRTPRRSR